MKYIKSGSELLAHERKKWDEGFSFIAGIDEAGRGPLAGPVVAAAVIFSRRHRIPIVNDSKKLSEKQRLEMRENILAAKEVRYSIIEIGPEEIDTLNILRATHQAMKKAVLSLEVAEFALIDGLPVPDFPLPSEAIVKGDSKSASIAAASILAKTRRDEIMMEMDKLYPEYGFARHKGYGTEDHVEALKKYGPCPIHRKSFAPVRDIINPPPEQLSFLF
ncbi:MAG: ribonuclease HII [Candidatus Izemoplasmatales bacterium]|nr:ribonuclease HII [Candidatus Izemoplasmatales bacterium]